jgi:hypothetical protein
MRSRTLVLLGALVLYPADHVRGQQSGDRSARYVLDGSVRDTAGVVVPQARIGLMVADSVVQVTRADSFGVFRLEGLPEGVSSIVVRRLGYRARVFTVVVEPRAANRLDAVLTPVPRELGGMRVSAKVDEPKGRLRDFYEHRERAQFGYFIDLDEIAKRRPLYPSELLRALPGVRLQRSSGIGSQVRVRGCRPLLWVNGLRIADGEFDDTVSLDDIAALEVYTSFAGMPAQFLDRETNCGAIVVWTRS